MLQLYNTLTRKKEEFKPQNPERVTMYACGMTVYNYIHVGNARMSVVFDTLFRVLKQLYPHVVFAQNITDIDDKIITKAAEEGVSTEVITRRYTDALLEDMKNLNVLTPDFQPKATDYIPEMITMIEKLIGNGHAYEKDGHVLFNVPSYPEYGALAKRNRDEQIAGARVDVAPYKKDPADFVLWKPSTDDQPGWSSPWGRGRPGWHIECSAMSTEILGPNFDIHGGGQDLTFPHHENEIAQSCCANKGSKFARFWVHNGFINVNNEKMSKSLGNFHFLRDVLKEFPGEAVRYVLMSAQYRQPLEFNFDLLTEAKRILDKFYRTITDYEVPATQPTEKFMNALKDDMNTPQAYAELHGLVIDIGLRITSRVTQPGDSYGDVDEIKKRVGQFKACANVLGFMNMSVKEWFQGASNDNADIEAAIEARKQARANKNFAESDRIRDELAAKGIILDDGASGTTWRRA